VCYNGKGKNKRGGEEGGLNRIQKVVSPDEPGDEWKKGNGDGKKRGCCGDIQPKKTVIGGQEGVLQQYRRRRDQFGKERRNSWVINKYEEEKGGPGQGQKVSAPTRLLHMGKDWEKKRHSGGGGGRGVKNSRPLVG